MYYCVCCNKIFDNKSYNALSVIKNKGNQVKCPMIDCNCNIIELDELMVPLIHELFIKGIRTINSCSGHSWEDSVPYFTYDFSPEIPNADYVTVFTKQLIKLSKNPDYTFLQITNQSTRMTYTDITGIKRTTNRQIKVTGFVPKRIDASDLENQDNLLFAQKRFIKAINKTITETDIICKKD